MDVTSEGRSKKSLIEDAMVLFVLILGVVSL